MSFGRCAELEMQVSFHHLILSKAIQVQASRFVACRKSSVNVVVDLEVRGRHAEKRCQNFRFQKWNFLVPDNPSILVMSQR